MLPEHLQLSMRGVLDSFLVGTRSRGDELLRAGCSKTSDFERLNLLEIDIGKSSACVEPKAGYLGKRVTAGMHACTSQMCGASRDNLARFARHDRPPVEQWRRLAHTAASRDSVVGS